MRYRLTLLLASLSLSIVLLAAHRTVAAPDDGATSKPAGGGSGDMETVPGIVDATDKAAIDAVVNKIATVEGVISSAAWSKTGKVMNIEFKGTESSRFCAVVFVKNRETLDTAFGGDLAKALNGARVRIKGPVKPYASRGSNSPGRPQIVIDKQSQITIVEPPPASAPSATQPAGQ